MNVDQSQGAGDLFSQLKACVPEPNNVANVEPLSIPAIQSLSLRKANKIDVRGSTSARKGVVEAFSQNAWKGIANVAADGTFHNPDVPSSYLQSDETILVRVVSDGTSTPVLANDYFVHPRSVAITPTQTKQADQQAYRWWLQWADYQPTGYRLPPNTRGSIILQGDASNVTATIGIQGLAKQHDRSQQTENMREYRLSEGENVLPTDPLGGVLHIRNNGTSTCQVIIGTAFQPIPYYILGATPPDDFHRMLELSPSQCEVQLVGDRVVISAYADTYKRFAHSDVGEIVRSHQEVLNIQALACGLDDSWPTRRRSNMWIHAVEAASSRTPHAATGYIALPHGSNPGNGYMCALLAGEAHKRWVTLHEYGHHFQNQVNALNPMFSENTVNIYALAVGRVHRHDYSDEFPTRWAALKNWLAKPRDQKHYMESPDTQAIFEQLRKALSDFYLPAWDCRIRENPEFNNDLVGFCTSLSQTAVYNLAEFLADWGVIKENDETWQALFKQGLPAAPKGMTDVVPYS